MSGRIEKYNLTTGETVDIYNRISDVRKDGLTMSCVHRCITGQKKTYKGFGWRRLEDHGLKGTAVSGKAFLLVDGFKQEVQTFKTRIERRAAVDKLRDNSKKYRLHKTEILIQLDL